MKASELIAKLESLVSLHGDLGVCQMGSSFQSPSASAFAESLKEVINAHGDLPVVLYARNKQKRRTCGGLAVAWKVRSKRGQCTRFWIEGKDPVETKGEKVFLCTY